MALGLLIGMGGALAAQAAEDLVTLKADTLTLDPASESYQAKGSVRMVRDGVSLLADSVSYNRLTEEAVAQGGVILERGGDLLKGDRLLINLGTQQGELLNGDIFLKTNNFRVRGQRLEKTGETDYRLERGSFTTCDGPRPSWRFEAREIEVTLEEYATGRDAVFYLGNVPVLYTPYLIFPVKTERQSGFLLPKPGHSTKKGFFFYQPFYWVIDPTQDATFALEVQSARGLGTGLEYRYLRPRGSEGALQMYGIYDNKVDRFRGELHLRQLEFFSSDTTLSSSIHVVTDRSYYRDFGEFSGDYNRQLQESTLSLDHKWERYNVTGLLSYVQDLVSPNNDLSLQRLPALRFVGAGEKLGPLYFSMNSAAVNFQRGLGVTGQRLVIHPRLSYYAKPSEALDLSLYGGYQQRLYNTYGGEAPEGVQTVGLADAGALLALPLEKVYNGAFRHVITPSLGFGYLQQKQQEQLPFFDYDDRVPGGSMVTWSVASLLTAKQLQESGLPSYRDLLSVRISQGYQLSGTRRDLLTIVDEKRRLTDIMLESRLSPVKGVSLAVDSRFNPNRGYFSTANFSALAQGERDKRAEFSYRFSRSPNQFPEDSPSLDSVHYLEGRLQYPILKPLLAHFLGRYSLDQGKRLESRYALEYRHQCWSLTVHYGERPGNTTYGVSFTLSGLVGGAAGI